MRSRNFCMFFFRDAAFSPKKWHQSAKVPPETKCNTQFAKVARCCRLFRLVKRLRAKRLVAGCSKRAKRCGLLLCRQFLRFLPKLNRQDVAFKHAPRLAVSIPSIRLHSRGIDRQGPTVNDAMPPKCLPLPVHIVAIQLSRATRVQIPIGEGKGFCPHCLTGCASGGPVSVARDKQSIRPTKPDCLKFVAIHASFITMREDRAANPVGSPPLVTVMANLPPVVDEFRVDLARAAFVSRFRKLRHVPSQKPSRVLGVPVDGKHVIIVISRQENTFWSFGGLRGERFSDLTEQLTCFAQLVCKIPIVFIRPT